MGNAETKEGSYGYRIMKVAPGSPAQQVKTSHTLFLTFRLALSNFWILSLIFQARKSMRLLQEIIQTFLKSFKTAKTSKRQ